MKFRTIFALSAMVFTQQVLADDTSITTTTTTTTPSDTTTVNPNGNMTNMAPTTPSTMPTAAPSNNPCDAIAKACLSAGFMSTDTPGKRFWFDCMKPLLLGKPVMSVTIMPAMVQACRTAKINELTKELEDLQEANKQGGMVPLS